MPPPKVHAASRVRTLAFALLLVAVGIGIAWMSGRELYAWQLGIPPRDPRVVLVFPAGVAIAIVGAIIGFGGLRGLPRLTLSASEIVIQTTLGTHSAHWTSLGPFEIGGRGRVLSAPVIGPEASARTIRAGRITVPSLGYGLSKTALGRELSAYRDSALAQSGLSAPDPTGAPPDGQAASLPPPAAPARLRRAAIVFAVQWLALVAGIVLGIAVALMTKHFDVRRTTYCLIGVSLLAGTIVSRRSWRPDAKAALLGCAAYAILIIALAGAKLRHVDVLFVMEGLTVPAFFLLGLWRASRRRKSVVPVRF